MPPGSGSGSIKSQENIGTVSLGEYRTGKIEVRILLQYIVFSNF